MSSDIDMNLSAIKQADPYAMCIEEKASRCIVFSFDRDKHQWENTNAEGPLFLYQREAPPYHSFIVLNTKLPKPMVEPIVSDLQFKEQGNLLTYFHKKTRQIKGIWFDRPANRQRFVAAISSLASRHGPRNSPKILRPTPIKASPTKKLGPTGSSGNNLQQLLQKADLDYEISSLKAAASDEKSSTTNAANKDLITRMFTSNESTAKSTAKPTATAASNASAESSSGPAKVKINVTDLFKGSVPGSSPTDSHPTFLRHNSVPATLNASAATATGETASSRINELFKSSPRTQAGSVPVSAESTESQSDSKRLKQMLNVVGSKSVSANPVGSSPQRMFQLSPVHQEADSLTENSMVVGEGNFASLTPALLGAPLLEDRIDPLASSFGDASLAFPPPIPLPTQQTPPVPALADPNPASFLLPPAAFGRLFHGDDLNLPEDQTVPATKQHHSEEKTPAPSSISEMLSHRSPQTNSASAGKKRLGSAAAAPASTAAPTTDRTPTALVNSWPESSTSSRRHLVQRNEDSMENLLRLNREEFRLVLLDLIQHDDDVVDGLFAAFQRKLTTASDL